MAIPRRESWCSLALFHARALTSTLALTLAPIPTTQAPTPTTLAPNPNTLVPAISQVVGLLARPAVASKLGEVWVRPAPDLPLASSPTRHPLHPQCSTAAPPHRPTAPPPPPPHRSHRSHGRTAAPPHRCTEPPPHRRCTIRTSATSRASPSAACCASRVASTSCTSRTPRWPKGSCSYTLRARVRARANPSPNLSGVAAQPQGCSYMAPTSDITPEMRPIPNPSSTHPGDSAWPARSGQGRRRRWLRRGRSEAAVRERAAPGGRGGACDRARVPGRRDLPAAGNPNPSLTLTLAPALTLALTRTLSLRCSDPDRARSPSPSPQTRKPSRETKEWCPAFRYSYSISSGLSSTT